jgi:hypothetical protein
MALPFSNLTRSAVTSRSREPAACAEGDISVVFGVEASPRVYVPIVEEVRIVGKSIFRSRFRHNCENAIAKMARMGKPARQVGAKILKICEPHNVAFRRNDLLK